MVEINAKFIRVLQVLGILFLLAAGAVIGINLVPGISWDQPSSIFFLAFLLLCGLSFGITGLMTEKPDKTRKLFFEWLIVVAAILIWVVGVYALIFPIL